MTQIYLENGVAVPVTVIEAGPCTVLQSKTAERDGYHSLQLGFLDKPRRRATRPERGHVAKVDAEPKRFVREVRLDNRATQILIRSAISPEVYGKIVNDLQKLADEQKTTPRQPGQLPPPDPKFPDNPAEFSFDQIHFEDGYRDRAHDLIGQHVQGQTLNVSMFAKIPAVDVVGTSKGRGTAGVMKRHNFKGLRASHGVKRMHRHRGSSGSSADPARVVKGTRMQGHWGNERSTVSHLDVVRIDPENNVILVKGGVPGPNGGYVIVQVSKRIRDKKLWS